jgi:hypothetical protein
MTWGPQWTLWTVSLACSRDKRMTLSITQQWVMRAHQNHFHMLITDGEDGWMDGWGGGGGP